jgi:hypothetical protein
MYDQVAACCSICGEKLQSRQCASCLSLERQRALATSIKEGTVTPPEGRLLMVSAAGAEITMAIRAVSIRLESIGIPIGCDLIQH